VSDRAGGSGRSVTALTLGDFTTTYENGLSVSAGNGDRIVSAWIALGLLRLHPGSCGHCQNQPRGGVSRRTTAGGGVPHGGNRMDAISSCISRRSEETAGDGFALRLTAGSGKGARGGAAQGAVAEAAASLPRPGFSVDLLIAELNVLRCFGVVFEAANTMDVGCRAQAQAGVERGSLLRRGGHGADGGVAGSAAAERAVAEEFLDALGGIDFGGVDVALAVDTYLVQIVELTGVAALAAETA